MPGLMLEAVVDPIHPNHAEANRFSPKFLLNDTVAPARRVIPALALVLLVGGARRTPRITVSISIPRYPALTP
jgi:hypothetical protein